MALQDAVNRKRVARIMREDNLLAVQPKRFVTTTDSKHGAGSLSEPGPAHAFNRQRSALDRRYDLHPACRPSRLPGTGPGRIFAQGGGLEAGQHAVQPSRDSSAGTI